MRQRDRMIQGNKRVIKQYHDNSKEKLNMN